MVTNNLKSTEYSKKPHAHVSWIMPENGLITLHKIGHLFTAIFLVERKCMCSPRLKMSVKQQKKESMFVVIWQKEIFSLLLMLCKWITLLLLLSLLYIFPRIGIYYCCFINLELLFNMSSVLEDNVLLPTNTDSKEAANTVAAAGGNVKKSISQQRRGPMFTAVKDLLVGKSIHQGQGKPYHWK